MGGFRENKTVELLRFWRVKSVLAAAQKLAQEQIGRKQ